MGRIASLKRMAVHDGPGLRTTLFLKGCPLRCRWCHNPECISPKPEVAYLPEKCLSCGACVALCRANRITEKGHVFDRSLCSACGQCEEICLGRAFTYYGREMTVQEAVELLLEDRAFYEASGGGVTLSGGEPLMQASFSAAILQKIKREGIHTAVDTCGFAGREALDEVIPYTDLFLLDIKAASSQLHRACTGQPNEPILRNLEYLNRLGKPMEIRVPYIPGWNDREMPQIAHLLKGLQSVTMVRLLPYHPYAASKYTSLGCRYEMPETVGPSRETMQRAVEVFLSQGLNAVDGGHLK